MAPAEARRCGLGLDGLNFLVAAMQAAFGVFVTVRLVASGWHAAEVGIALTVSTVATLLTQIPAGAAIDAMSDKRRAVQAGIIGLGGAALLLAVAPAGPAIYVAQALQGLASSLIAPGIAAISLVLVGHDGFGARVGRNARFASIGAGLTAGAMGVAGSWFSPVTIFWMAAFLALPAFACATMARHGYEAEPAGDGGPPPDAARPSWQGVRALLRDRRLLVFACAIVLFFVGNAALAPGIAARITLRVPAYATLLVAGATLLPQVIVAATSPWVARMADRHGRRPVLLLGWSLVPVQGVLYALLPGLPTLLLGQAINGVSSAVFGVMMSVVTADLTRGTRRFNMALGALGMAVAAGGTVSTFMGGLVAGAFGASAGFLALAFAGALGVTVLWAGLPETRRAPYGAGRSSGEPG